MVIHTVATKAPSPWERDLWFEKDTELTGLPLQRFHSHCFSSLVAVGIDEASCPTLSDYAAQPLVSSLVQALTGEVIDPAQCESTRTFMCDILWKQLWWAHEHGDRTCFDPRFMAWVLRSFRPHQYSGGPDRPTNESQFEWLWRFGGYGTLNSSVSSLTIQQLRSGQAKFKTLPPGFQTSIRRVAQFMPDNLERVVSHVRATFHW